MIALFSFQSLNASASSSIVKIIECKECDVSWSEGEKSYC